MRFARWTVVCFALMFAGASIGCKDACDDLEDICKSCNEENKDDCKSTHSACTIIKGPASKDCCEGIVDDWEDYCE